MYTDERHFEIKSDIRQLVDTMKQTEPLHLQQQLFFSNYIFGPVFEFYQFVFFFVKIEIIQ